MTNAIAKAVINELADLYTRPRYFSDYLTSLRDTVAKGDTVEVPNIGTLTVTQASSSGSPSDVSNQSVTPSILSLTVDQEPAIFCELPAMRSTQYLDGAFPQQLATQGLTQLRNSVDATIASYFATSVAWDTAGTYHQNPGISALSRSHILTAKAALEANDGAHNLAMFVSAYAQGSIMNITEFIPNFTAAEKGMLGIPQLGSVFGVPVFTSNSIPSAITSTASASNIATNVCTFTVPAGHGFVPGQKVTTAGFTVNLSTATAITSVTASTIVAPVTGSNGSNGVGTITSADALNLLVDLPHAYIAMQKMPTVRVVPFYNRTSDSLQLSCVYGRLGRAGRVQVIHTPATTI